MIDSGGCEKSERKEREEVRKFGPKKERRRTIR